MRIGVPVFGSKQSRVSPAGTGRSPGERGFTLLEMLVAVAILAVLAGMIPRSFVYARALINRSESWMEARIVAEAVLNGELGGELRPGTRRGTIEGRAWTATLRRNAEFSGAGAESDRAVLDVLITVPVSSRESLELETIRIGSAR